MQYLASLALIALPQVDSDVATQPELTPRESVQRDAAAMLTIVESELAKQFLRATQDLPAIIEPRIVYWSRPTR